MSQERTEAGTTQRFRVEVLHPVRQGSTVEFPEDWQVIDCDVTGDAGGYWVELVVLTPVSSDSKRSDR